MAGRPVKSAAAHAPPCAHALMLTPPAVVMYQFKGLTESMAATPPSPVLNCAQALAALVAPTLLALPFAPAPTINCVPSVGFWATLTTSASDPSEPFKF